MSPIGHTPRKPEVVIYVRHASSCQYRADEAYPACDCPKSLRWSTHGRQHRVSLHTRTWGHAEAARSTKQKELDVQFLIGANPELAPLAPAATASPTIAQYIETVFRAKESENIRHSTLRKLRYQLGLFERFLAGRSKFVPRDITSQDLIDFRASWKWGDLTRIKAQQNLRGFIRFCCRGDHRDELLEALARIKQTREGTERRKPKPLSESEIAKLLAQVHTTFPDPSKAARVKALIRCMVSTGLAIRDTIQLERNSIHDGWLRIERQKTGKPVMQKLDPALHRELLAVTNGNPRYIFWSGIGLPSSATTNWQRDLRQLMEDAGVWIKGNLSHRFRDTAVDFWLGRGCSMTEIAAMLGDTVAVVEKHYADLASKRMEERLSKMPVRSWGEIQE
jgi:integrase